MFCESVEVLLVTCNGRSIPAFKWGGGDEFLVFLHLFQNLSQRYAACFTLT